MKTYLPYILIVILLAVIYLVATELLDINRTQQVEIDFLRAKNIQEKDLLLKRLKLKDDSLKRSTIIIALQADTIKSDKAIKEKYKRDTHDKIHFIQFANDSKRDSMLTTLYPSFRPIR